MDFDVIILAGGKSRRMGQDKAGIELAGKTLLEHALDNARTWGAKEILIAGPPRDWLPAQYILDPPGFEPSSLLGIYAGMLASTRPWRLVTGCDMPFVSQDFVRALWQEKNQGGAVAMWHNRLQPLPGLYPRVATETIHSLLLMRRYHLAAVLDYLSPAVISAPRVAEFDAEGLNFFNINSPEDLEQAKMYK